jgi:hypothetical protein
VSSDMKRLSAGNPVVESNKCMKQPFESKPKVDN